MTYSADSVVVGVDPDLSAEQFAQVLSDAGSPAAAEAHAAYVALTAYRVSPRYALAVFHHESRYGTDPQSVNVRYGTKNPGNNRSLRAKIPNASVIQTDRGAFVAYPTWADGFTDMAARLVDPSYVYAQRGLKTPAQIIPTSAPASDGNDPTAYITDVVTMMNDYPQGQAGGTSVSDLWPTTEEIGWPVTVEKADADIGPARAISAISWYVIHDTEGHRTGDLQVLEHADPAQASVHFWISKQGEIVAIVPIGNTSWTVANQSVDVVAINFEQEGYETEERTEQQYRALAALLRWCRSKGVTVPFEYVGRDERPGIIGHKDVANPDVPGAWGGESGHTDPGPLYDFNKLVAYTDELVPQQTVTPSNERKFAGIDYAIHDGFKVYWEKLDQAGFALLALGYPKSDEVKVSTEGTDRVMQRFERGALIWEPENPIPWDVHHATVEQIQALDAVLAPHP